MVDKKVLQWVAKRDGVLVGKLAFPRTAEMAYSMAVRKVAWWDVGVAAMMVVSMALKKASMTAED